MDQTPQFPQNATTISALVLKRFPGWDKPDAAPGLRIRAAQYRLELEATAKRLSAPAADPLEGPTADFEYYAKLSYWTVDEAVALSMGRVPFPGGWQYAGSYRQVSYIAVDFGWRREIVERARIMGQLWDNTIPAVFVAWANRMDFQLPVELIAAVERRGFQIADWKTNYDEAAAELADARATIEQMQGRHLAQRRDDLDKFEERLAEWQGLADKLSANLEKIRAKNFELAQRNDELEKAKPVPVVQKSELGARERQTLLKIIVGQAVKNYGFEPKRARNAAAGEIASDLATVGISVSEDTIRNYLNEAKEIVDLPDLG